MSDEQKPQNNNHPELVAESKPTKHPESEMRGRGKRGDKRVSYRRSRRKGSR